MPPQVLVSDPLVRGHPVNRGLLAWWCHLPPSDGGAFVYDRAGEKALHGDCTNSGPSTQGALPRPGALGPPMSFGAGTQRLTVALGHERLFDNQFTFTVAFWFMARSFANSPILYSHGEANTNFFAELKTSGDGLYWGSGGGGSYRTYSGWGLSTHTWYHLTIVRQGDGDNGNVYLNGAVNMSYTGIINSIAGETGKPLWLGNYTSSVLGLDGAIDDFRVYHRAFTASQAAALYDESRLGYPNAVRRVRYYAPDEASAATPVDATAAGSWAVNATVSDDVASLWGQGGPAIGDAPLAWADMQTVGAGRESAHALLQMADRGVAGDYALAAVVGDGVDAAWANASANSLLDNLAAAWPLNEAPGLPRLDVVGSKDLASCFPGDSSAHPVYLGSGTAGHGWSGAMARFFRYDRRLTSGEKSSIWNFGAGVKWADVSGGSLGDALFWYDLDEATGSGDRVDATGRNTALEASASLSRVTGPDGTSSAVQFTGSNYLYHADAADFRTTGQQDWAIGLWVNADNVDTTGVVDYFAGKATADLVEWLFYYAHQATRSRWQIDLGYAESDPELATVKADAAGKPNAGQWYFLLMELDASTNTLSLTVDNTYTDSLQPVFVPDRAHGPVANHVSRFAASESFDITNVPTARPATKFVSCASDGTSGDPLRGGDRDWTMAGWLKLSSLSDNFQRIVGKMSETGPALDYQLSWFTTGGGRLYGEVSDGGGSNFASAFVALTDTDWHFFVFSYNAATNTVSIELDDSGSPGTDTAGFTPAATAHDFRVGCSGTNVDRQFVGDIGPLFFYERLLTDEEQTQLYNGGEPLYYPFVFAAVDASAATAWSLAQRAPSSVDAGWADASVVTPGVASSWGLTSMAGQAGGASYGLAQLAASGGETGWALAGVAGAPAGSSWSLAQLAASGGEAGWALAAPAPGAVDAQWSMGGAVAADGVVAYHLGGVVTTSQGASWALHQTVVVGPSAAWALYEAVGPAGHSSWAQAAFLAEVAAAAAASWSLRELAGDSGGAAYALLATSGGGVWTDWACRSVTTRGGASAWALHATVTDDAAASWSNWLPAANAAVGSWALSAATGDAVEVAWRDYSNTVVVQTLRLSGTVRRALRLNG